MVFGGFNKSAAAAPLADINMVRLIDVMLVLLVIFIITAPLLMHSVKIDLPKATHQPTLTQPEHIELSITASGTRYWNGEAVSQAETAARFTAAAKRQPQPELHIRADRSTQYQNVAEVMAAAARAGLTRIGFVTDPRESR